MNLIPCPLCGSRKFESYCRDHGYDGRDYSVVKCVSCGFKFLNPQPSDEALNRIYSTYYGSADESEKTATHLDFRKPVFEELCGRIEPFRSTGARLLDIGCGNGEFLSHAKSRGWTVAGVEVAEPAARFAREKRGLDVKTGTFDDLPFEPSSFDVVTILDVLEHVRFPQETLLAINNVLKPGGHLVIRVPNTPFQIFKAKLQRLRRGPDFTTLAAPLHLNHFDSGSLSRAVRNGGFEIESVEPGTADGAGLTLAVKKTYVSLSRVLAKAGIQTGNILSMTARKP